MQIKAEINVYQFRDMFRDAGREGQFSYEALGALFEWLEEYYDGSGESWDGDIIALCCDYAEDTWQNIVEGYRIDLSGCDDDEEKRDAVIAYIEEHSVIVAAGYDGPIVYQIF